MNGSRFSEEVLDRIAACGVIAVLVVDDAQHAVPLARALLDGGIDAMELTLRTPAALDALRCIRRDMPRMLAGVGTVLTPQQVRGRGGGGRGVRRRPRHQSHRTPRGGPYGAALRSGRGHSFRPGDRPGARLPRSEVLPRATMRRG